MFWGVSTSAVAGVGISPASDLSLWQRDGRIAHSGDGNGFATRYRDDFSLLAEHGCSTLRYGLDWARIEPRPGEFDGDELEFLQSMLDAARSNGINVWLGLHHDSIPGWFIDEGGFIDDRIRSRVWPRYVDVIAEAVGDQVAGWFPIHDITGFAAGAYRRGTRPPGLRDPEMAAKAVRGMWLAWRDAWRLLRGGPPVATSIWLPLLFPADETITATNRSTGVRDRTWTTAIRALRDGELDVPGLAVQEIADLAGSADHVGVLWRGAISVNGQKTDDFLGQHGPYPVGSRTDDIGYAPWTQGLAAMFHELNDELPGRSFLLAGTSLDTTDEAWRTDIVGQTRQVCNELVADSIDLRGAFWSSFTDGYDHRRGTQGHTGLFDRDRNVRAALRELT